MKKIYITGIAGLLGNTIAQELKSKYQICGADAVKVNMEAVSYDCIDLTNYELLEKSGCCCSYGGSCECGFM